jgi:perosamine synthetase
MIGQEYKGKPCGSFGDISTFSFFSNKHITTGEGGMVVTNDDDLADRCRSLRNLCFGPGNNRFIHEELGWNFRMTNLQAALGLAQLERLDEFIKIKRKVGRFYTEQLQDIDKFQLPLAETDYAKNIYWVYGIVLKDDVSINASKMMQLLADEKIGTRPFFYPMNKQPVFIKMGLFKNVECPVAQNLAERGFYIPGGLAITEDQMKRVIDVLKQISRKI